MVASVASMNPLPGETQVQFLDRVFSAVPGDTDHRTAVALASWANSGREREIESIARRLFPKAKFRRVRNRPVFVEHTKVRVKRDPVTGEEREITERYDRNALAAIVDRCNERILDTKDFSPITEGHTPDSDDVARGARMPEVLGYAGPYRLGKIGNKNPRWAIFCDEFHHHEAVPRIDRLQRRSPEVWLEERMQDRFFDPIAALGAETPRLDTGLGRFGRRRDGLLIEKYSAAAVAPSGHNAFIPTDGGERKRQDYAGEPGATNGATNMLDPNDIREIVDAIEQLDWVQGVKQLLAEQGAGEPTGADTGMPGADAGPPAEPAAPDAAPPPPPAPEAAAPAPAPEPPKQPYECDDEDRDMMSRYAAGEVSDDEMMDHMQSRKESYSATLGEGSSTQDPPITPGDSASVGDRAPYSRSEHDTKVRYARLERDHKALQGRVKTLEAERRDQYRRAKLAEKQAEGFCFDLDAEMREVADFNDQQFDRHLARVERYERNGLDVPRLHTPSLEARETEKYQRQRAEGIQKLASERRAAGKECSWDEAAREWDKSHAAAQAG